MGMLENKIILITGATSGIGRESALLFASEGAKVAITGRRETEGAEVVREIEKAGGEAIFIQADLADITSIEPTIEKVVERFGRIDAAFNNAGVGGGRTGIAERTSDEWDNLFNINLKSAFFCLRAQTAQFRKQGAGGSVLFNASVLGSIGMAGTTIYGASKGGVISLARTAAVELGPEGIRVNTISPSITRTPMTAGGFIKHDDGTAEHPVAALTPLRRVAEPIEIARAAMFLLSDMSSFITGHDLIVDGGVSAGR